eukprot:11171744-Lingulodinium_polyedra.AAC.1
MARTTHRCESRTSIAMCDRATGPRSRHIDQCWDLWNWRYQTIQPACSEIFKHIPPDGCRASARTHSNRIPQ